MADIVSEEHLPVRPAWLCGTCDTETDWPCPPARVALAEEYADIRPALSTYMLVQFVDAATDMPRVPLAELEERFLDWPRALRMSLDAS